MTARRRLPKHALPWRSVSRGPTRSTFPCGRGAGAPIESPAAWISARRGIAIPAARSSRAASARMVTGSSRRHPPTGSGLTAASLPGDRFVNARNASSCSPAGVAARCGHHPFAPEEPEPQEQPRHDRYEDRQRGDGHRQQHREPARRGVQVMAGAGDVQSGLAGRGQRLADRIAQQRNVLCAMARRRQVVGNPLRAAFHLSAGVGDRRDGAVHSETDEHPYHRPHRDGDIAHQLGEQSQRFGGVRHEPHGTDTSTLCD